ncbi:MAG: hypothetical protein ACYDC3_05420, partial [Candidatus Binataceae bacterium]
MAPASGITLAFVSVAAPLIPAESQAGESQAENDPASIKAASPGSARLRVVGAFGGTPEAEHSTARMVRGAGLLVFAFEAALLLALGLGKRDLSFALISFHAAGAAAGAVLFALSFGQWGMRQWRIAALAACMIEIVAAAGITCLTGDPGTLSVTILAVVVVAGALLPWSGRWQAALGAFALGSFALLASTAPVPFSDMLWLRVSIAVILAQVIVMMIARDRRELEEQSLVVRQSDRRLRIEIAGRAKAERRGELSAATTRTVFENLSDIAIIGTLGDHKFAMVNHAFETAFGCSRAEILGRPIMDVDFWVSAQQRESFVAEMEAGRMVRNLEADFR